jgi:hypothetical protein
MSLPFPVSFPAGIMLCPTSLFVTLSGSTDNNLELPDIFAFARASDPFKIDQCKA